MTAICELWKQYGNVQLHYWAYCFWSYAMVFLLIQRIPFQVSHPPTVTFTDVALLFLICPAQIVYIIFTYAVLLRCCVKTVVHLGMNHLVRSKCADISAITARSEKKRTVVRNCISVLSAVYTHFLLYFLNVRHLCVVSGFILLFTDGSLKFC